MGRGGKAHAQEPWGLYQPWRYCYIIFGLFWAQWLSQTSDWIHLRKRGPRRQCCPLIILTFKLELELSISNQMSLLQSLCNHPLQQNHIHPWGITYNPWPQALQGFGNLRGIVIWYIDYLEQMAITKFWSDSCGERGHGLFALWSLLTLKMELELSISNQMSSLQRLWNHPFHKNRTCPQGVAYNVCPWALGRLCWVQTFWYLIFGLNGTKWLS